MNTLRNTYTLEKTLTRPTILKADNLLPGDLIYGELVAMDQVNFSGKMADTFTFQLTEGLMYANAVLPVNSLVQLTGSAFSTCKADGKFTIGKIYCLHFQGKIKLKDGKPYSSWSIQQLKMTSTGDTNASSQKETVEEEITFDE